MWQVLKEKIGSIFHSFQLDKRKLRKLDNQVKSEQQVLEKEITALKSKQFACLPDAEAALAYFTKVHKGGLFKITGSVDLIEIPEKRLKPGRPSKGEQRSCHSCYSVTASITLDQSCYDKMKEKLSCFVIITNQPDLSAEEIFNRIPQPDCGGKPLQVHQGSDLNRTT